MKLEQREVGEQQSPVPDTVTSDYGRQLYHDANMSRRMLKDLAKDIDITRRDPATRELDQEVGANLTLALRHIEDASMRLGKVLQALDGGVSVYDKSTTVGA